MSSVVLQNVVPPLEPKVQFRNYVNSPLQSKVSMFYFTQHKNQTFETVMRKKEQFGKTNRIKMSIWDAIKKLDEIVDTSDPDTELPQIIHALQTAESIRKEFPGEEYDWFHLTGLIHDLGKVLSHPDIYDEPQWAVVGDTHPVGCKFSDLVVFPEYFAENGDSYNPLYNTEFGIYAEGCGFDNVHFAWGHDEYMYQVCKNNGSTLPEPALYVIRYHSFYSWHQEGAYSYLANDFDREMLKYLKAFQKHDLYSKLPEIPNMDNLMTYYKGLVKKYFPEELSW